jgi:RNA polymerase sigma factor (sigma-70 family)
MESAKQYLPPRPGTGAQFGATHWSVVLAAKDNASPTAEAAMARLCESYWYPAYAFLRRKGHSCHEAEDLTQGFFAHLLRREWLRNVGPEKGRFRTFVLRCLTNFVISQRRPPRMISLDFTEAEQRYSLEPKDEVTPARLFEIRWAVAVLDSALERLRREEAESPRKERIDLLAPYLSKETAPASFADVAYRLGISAEAARQEVSRLRKRYREAIREEIAETVSGRQEIEAELQHLILVLTR